METIKVNMNPNPLDVQTIHASQGDTEARQWEFELHNNGEKIDSSSISDQLVFKAYKGGTEEILPTNGSVPTTSPFKGDIKYPQGLLSDQEFTYRQSPTESDGLAKITDIKGNTLVWNQLVQNGNFADTSEWSAESGATLSISNNIATISSTTANNGIRQYFPNPLTVGHKYLIKAEFNVPTERRCVIGTASNQGVQTDKLISTTNTWTEVSGIGTCTVATTSFYCFARGITYENVKIRNVVCFDLTQMGLDISNPSDFASLFPLSYYSYNQGSLLSFNGNGIKTVGFNQWDEEWEAGSLDASTGVPIVSTVQIRSKNYCPCISGLEYYFHSSKTDGGSENIYYFAVFFYDNNKNFLSRLYTNRQKFKVPTNASYFKISSNTSVVVYGNEYLNDICINISDDELNGTYEPYTSSTLSLPISTYFPTGMKQAGNVYDELTESKAITRVGQVALTSSLPWVKTSANNFYFALNSVKRSTDYRTTMTCDKMDVIQTGSDTTTNASPRWISAYVQNASYPGQNWVYIHVDGITTVDSLKTWLDNNPTMLNYELATPTETSFTTASLVTENAEIPLSNNDGVLIGKCTEQLSENPGFIDAKIKLTDSDGECYSNKIQFHVERSPK